VYYVIDCARPTSGGLPQAYTPGAEAAFNFANEIIVPVTLSTPNLEGEVIHEVQDGQSLWQIAIDYGVKIDEIRALNQLPTAYLINPGDTLLVKMVGTPTLLPATATATASPAPTLTPPVDLGLSAVPADSLTSTPRAPSTQASTAAWAVGAIVLVALASAALVAWIGRSRPV
jgi:LysM repeat protein